MVYESCCATFFIVRNVLEQHHLHSWVILRRSVIFLRKDHLTVLPLDIWMLKYQFCESLLFNDPCLNLFSRLATVSVCRCCWRISVVFSEDEVNRDNWFQLHFEMDNSIILEIICDFVATLFTLATFVVYKIVPEVNNLQGSLLRRYLATQLCSYVSWFLSRCISQFEIINIYDVHTYGKHVHVFAVSGNSFTQNSSLSLIGHCVIPNKNFVGYFSRYIPDLQNGFHLLVERDESSHLAKVTVSRILSSVSKLFEKLMMFGSRTSPRLDPDNQKIDDSVKLFRYSVYVWVSAIVYSIFDTLTIFNLDWFGE